MPLPLETPNRDRLCVVINPLPVRIVGRGPGPPEQRICFWPYEFEDPDYRCVRLLTAHTGERMVKRDTRLMLLKDEKGQAFWDAIEGVQEEFPELEARDVFAKAFKQVLNYDPPSIDTSAVDNVLAKQADERLDELNIPQQIYNNPEKPWPLWWKLMVIEDNALAWENWEEYTESTERDELAKAHETIAREARERSRDREKAKQDPEAQKVAQERAQAARERAEKRRGSGLNRGVTGPMSGEATTEYVSSASDNLSDALDEAADEVAEDPDG